MADWTEGYVTDIGYTFGYFNELNPLRVKLALLNAGLVFPDAGTACELGYGQGMSANLHAAASVTEWHGTDFSPSQAAFAQELASDSGAAAYLYDEAFADFANRTDLPEFDFIGLHGIWSWISDENRAVIVEFIRRKLKVGGVLYISYNTQPGWAAMVPMRDLLLEHNDVLGLPGAGIVNRFKDSLAFANKLMSVNPAYARANPQISERLNKLTEQDPNYLVHEYFNRNWMPMSFAAMTEWLSPAKVGYACSANYLDHVDAVNLSAEQQALLKEIPDVMFRETVRDFMVNQQFRKDYWVKGARKHTFLDQAEALRTQRVVLLQPRADVSLKVAGALGEATMQEAVYNPILDALADHKPKTLGQLEQQLKNIPFAQIQQAVMLLMGTGALLAAQDEDSIAKAKKTTDKLNAHLCNKSRGSSDISYLASPVLGGGLNVPRFHQLFLLSIGQGKKKPAEWAQNAWQVLAAQGQRLLKDGKTLESAEENLAELTAQATVFSEKHLPILKALQVV